MHRKAFRKSENGFSAPRNRRMSYKDIAKSLNMSEELVKVSLFRARRKIKELLEELNK
jgi:hypothetical protein